MLSLLSACGGGGGGEVQSTNVQQPTKVFCINSQITGCEFSINDPQQDATGWWNGTRIIDSDGSFVNAYLNVTNSNSLSLNLGDDFAQGSMSGTLQVGGSVFGTLKAAGTDAIAGGIGGSKINSPNGGVITKSILGFKASEYVTYISGGASLPQSATFRFTYNPYGDDAVSKYSGTYQAGLNQLKINSDGKISAKFIAFRYVTNNPTQECMLETTIPNSTLMRNVVISGIDSCASVQSIKLFYFVSNGVKRMVMDFGYKTVMLLQ